MQDQIQGKFAKNACGVRTKNAHTTTDNLADIETAKTGEVEHRSPYLPHAKRALYHLSYIP